MFKLEYIWIDGTEPTAQLRSKTKVLQEFDRNIINCPVWSFDGSSTNQAPGSDSDCVLKPMKLYENPMEKNNSYLVLCEVWDVDGNKFIDYVMANPPFNVSGDLFAFLGTLCVLRVEVKNLFHQLLAHL